MRTLHHTHLRRRVLAALAALATAATLAGGATGATTADAATRPTGPLVPASGVLLGAYTSSGTWTNNTDAMSYLASRESKLGRRFAIDSHYYSWRASIPSGLEQADLAGGRVPMVTWEPTEGLDGVLSGADDALVRQRARALKALARPVMLRFAHEMNGDWYPWGSTALSTPGTHDAPAKFVRAWRHVHDLFAAEGATNVVWVWSPNWLSVPTDSWNAFTNYYPGDAYVDWVATDLYNWGSKYGGWVNLSSLLKPVYNTYAATKPIMVAETSSVEGTAAQAATGLTKAAWVDKVRTDLQTTFPSVAALVWFDQKKNDVDWRFDTSASALTALKAMAADPGFAPRAGVTAPPLTPPSKVLVTLRPDRTGAVPLAGQTLSGLAYVRAEPLNGVEQVAFWLDDPQRTGAPRRVDTYAPYDLVDGTATNALDTSTLAAGSHTLTVASTVAGYTEVTTVTFAVANPPTAVPVSAVRLSTSPLRTNTLALNGKTVTGKVYVDARPVVQVGSIAFYLDDPTRSRQPIHTEWVAPYDLSGSTSSGTANPFDTSTLAAGAHTLTLLTTFGGRSEVTQVTFTKG